MKVNAISFSICFSSQDSNMPLSINEMNLPVWIHTKDAEDSKTRL